MNVAANNPDVCLRYQSTQIDDKHCSEPFYYICQYECPVTATTPVITTTTVTTTTTTTCQPPAGYSLEHGVDKYYKAVNQSVTRNQAKDACTGDGTILVEPRTAAEHLAMRLIFGNIFFNHI